MRLPVKLGGMKAVSLSKALKVIKKGDKGEFSRILKNLKALSENATKGASISVRAEIPSSSVRTRPMDSCIPRVREGEEFQKSIEETAEADLERGDVSKEILGKPSISEKPLMKFKSPEISEDLSEEKSDIGGTFKKGDEKKVSGNDSTEDGSQRSEVKGEKHEVREYEEIKEIRRFFETSEEKPGKVGEEKQDSERLTLPGKKSVKKGETEPPKGDGKHVFESAQAEIEKDTKTDESSLARRDVNDGDKSEEVEKSPDLKSEKDKDGRVLAKHMVRKRRDFGRRMKVGISTERSERKSEKVGRNPAKEEGRGKDRVVVNGRNSSVVNGKRDAELLDDFQNRSFDKETVRRVLRDRTEDSGGRSEEMKKLRSIGRRHERLDRREKNGAKMDFRRGRDFERYRESERDLKREPEVSRGNFGGVEKAESAVKIVSSEKSAGRSLREAGSAFSNLGRTESPISLETAVGNSQKVEPHRKTTPMLLKDENDRSQLDSSETPEPTGEVLKITSKAVLGDEAKAHLKEFRSARNMSSRRSFDGKRRVIMIENEVRDIQNGTDERSDGFDEVREVLKIPEGGTKMENDASVPERIEMVAGHVKVNVREVLPEVRGKNLESRKRLDRSLKNLVKNLKPQALPPTGERKERVFNVEKLEVVVERKFRRVYEAPKRDLEEVFEKVRELRKELEGVRVFSTDGQEKEVAKNERVSVEEMIERIRRIVESIRERPVATERARMELVPPDLGKVEVEIVKKDQNLVIVFKVVTDDAKEIIERKMDVLSQRLMGDGFNVEKIEVRMEKEEEELPEREEEKGQQEENHENEKRRKRREGEER